MAIRRLRADAPSLGGVIGHQTFQNGACFGVPRLLDCLWLAAKASGLDALHLLSSEMGAEETETRIAAMKRLDMVARALGPSNTAESLVPFLIGESWLPIYHMRFSPVPACRAR
jgi:hypothetical protein